MKKNKIILLLLALIFIAPSLSAYLLYKHPAWRSSQTTNKGELLSPAPALTLFDDSKWHIVLWSPNACTKTCMERLVQLTKLRLALGRRYYDTDLWLVLPDGNQDTELSQGEIQRMKKHGVRLIRLLSQNENITLLSAYPTSIFIATPQQRLILRYNQQSKLEDIYHDLKHLLTTTDGKNVS